MPASTIYVALAVQKFAALRSFSESKTRSGLMHTGGFTGGDLLLAFLSCILVVVESENVGPWKVFGRMSLVGGGNEQMDLW